MKKISCFQDFEDVKVGFTLDDKPNVEQRSATDDEETEELRMQISEEDMHEIQRV